jgi:hypothetical protein
MREMACRRAHGAGQHIALQHSTINSAAADIPANLPQQPLPLSVIFSSSRLAASPSDPNPPHGNESGNAQVSGGWSEDGAQRPGRHTRRQHSFAAVSIRQSACSSTRQQQRAAR